jgi:predicted dienelactone hydrolase
MRFVLRSFAALLLALAALPASAADCAGRQAAGYRVLTLETGRKVAVWYPAAGAEKPFPYTRNHNNFLGRVAFEAPPAACPRVPLVLFSHGLGGCGLQTLFLTEELARHGYVVAAPDHADSATCGIERDGLRLANMRTDQRFIDPRAWNDQSQISRLHDLRAAIGAVAADEALGRIADIAHVGAIGHSLGGYSVIGMAGGWPSWTTPQVKAVVALSPYVAPFVVHGTLGRLAAPVMYQGAQFDWGITPVMEGPGGAYAKSAAPKFFVKLAGGTHFEWTNFVCGGQPSVEACLKNNRNAYLITRYGIEFLDRYLKDKPAPALASGGAGLEKYEFELR